ncbi:MAG TPA: division/cell wall cluster transcriptional repressor MraZ [Acidimicrobiales bacterium]|nr:division/cell wall cluster transcriptional repressor MraZ [Acidimicrobiales bacterium]
MPGFVGRFDHSVDAKGRVILPAVYRPSFERGGYLTQGFERCLTLWTPGEFERQLADMQASYREGTPESRGFARVWSSGSVAVEIDRQGRMGIPAHLREFAGLDGGVLVAGVLDHIELWNPEEWRVRVAPAQDKFLGETA